VTFRLKPLIFAENNSRLKRGEYYKSRIFVKTKKILIVDDDPVNLQMLRRIFNDNEYSVIQAAGGVEAVEVAKNDHPDLIILDIVMPGIDGGEVANILKKDPSTQKIPIIFLSSLIKKAEEKYSSTREGVYLMAKPFDRHDLLEKVKEYT
jgi:CheY-like chemotaxis protein